VKRLAEYVRLFPLTTVYTTFAVVIVIVVRAIH